MSLECRCLQECRRKWPSGVAAVGQSAGPSMPVGCRGGISCRMYGRLEVLQWLRAKDPPFDWVQCLRILNRPEPDRAQNTTHIAAVFYDHGVHRGA